MTDKISNQPTVAQENENIIDRHVSDWPIMTGHVIALCELAQYRISDSAISKLIQAKEIAKPNNMIGNMYLWSRDGVVQLFGVLEKKHRWNLRSQRHYSKFTQSEAERGHQLEQQEAALMALLVGLSTDGLVQFLIREKSEDWRKIAGGYLMQRLAGVAQ